ncbi:putative poly(ADP-ribose) glycohydrolase [Trypanosoma rangeli]|uniref:Putative poly(ADP-ribose) glycohydrolase n=1 Tax=Trypanosoma rangeli TaxID=5698 RepID=A0A3R7MAK9_TRYRA|nr:putative poly(ADP-ribose) glycohydrolase [Trypanosoma rangeli]RNF12022.1 putative poly(ADP-ribose) glycohydrolase [Trypanosoma rangeli]|eukprot:RNF12022.1 putative poly(ADP-ribose) glycohydrolase [Trypanosoma rangeli]
MKTRQAKITASTRLQQRTLDYFFGHNGTTAPVALDGVSRECCCVTLPWSKENRCLGDAGQLCSAWGVIMAILARDASQNTMDLQILLQRLYLHDSFERVSSTFHFGALCYVIDHIMDSSERAAFFDVTLPWMKRLMREGPCEPPA